MLEEPSLLLLFSLRDVSLKIPSGTTTALVGRFEEQSAARAGIILLSQLREWQDHAGQTFVAAVRCERGLGDDRWRGLEDLQPGQPQGGHGGRASGHCAI